MKGTQKLTVSSTAVLLTYPPESTKATVRNKDGAVTVYAGPPGVTADNNATTGGFEIYAGEIAEFLAGDHQTELVTPSGQTAACSVFYE